MTDMRKKRRVSCLLSMLAFLGVVLVAIIVVTGYLAFQVPRWAERSFGPAAATLAPHERIYYSASLLLSTNDLLLPENLYGQPTEFEVELGDSPGLVAYRLEAQGLISDERSFRHYLIYKGLDTTLQAGEYQLSSAMSATEIAEALQDPTPLTATVHVLAGWRMEEIAEALLTTGLGITPEAFLQAAANPPAGYSFLEDLPPSATLEGFLFPGRYELSRDANANMLVEALLENFKAEVGDELYEGFSRQNLNVYEAVTLASIVEKEAVDASEMPIIASVFLNRLEVGLKLETDPTVQYALGYDGENNTWWTNPLSLQDLQVESPYNTYRNPGLPPGPIANPGLEALRSVAFPASTPYYYFRASCDGSGRHAFSETFEEHLGKACPE